MKVFVEAQAGLSRAMDRVVKAFKLHSPPDVQFVERRDDAELVILHVIGFPETVVAVKECRARGQRYALIQYCLRTTQESNTEMWWELWRDAVVVWSYYDLPMLCVEDHGTYPTDNFYHAPLGADPAFRVWPMQKRWLVATSGYVAESESVNEVAEAVRRHGASMFHLGPDLKLDARVTYHLGVSDPQLAQLYSNCTYVAGLRRVEGFELPAAEGLLCGARPVMFDRPHYRRWFEGFAEFIPEGDPTEVAQALYDLFTKPPRPVTDYEISTARALFSWPNVIFHFWDKANVTGAMVTPRVTVETKRRVLWVGDAGCSSGFARATHHVLDGLHARGWDVHALALNYFGDPHGHPYSLYPCQTVTGGDLFGLRRLPNLIDRLAPDVVVVQNDPWNLPQYMKRIGGTPTVGVIAVDGLNCAGAGLNGLASAVFWTNFGLAEARQGGYTGPAVVVPLGVDLDVYRPLDRREARLRLDLGRANDAFIVGNVNRNQPRKRLDLSIAYFAKWIRTKNVNDAYLYLHVGPTGDAGWDCHQLATYHGIQNRLILAEPEVGHGISEVGMAITYSAFDAQLSTTQGEGWGLTTMEGMACGVPQVVPRWAALGEWALNAAVLVECDTTAATPNYINVIGGVPSEANVIDALDRLYRDPSYRDDVRARGLALARQSEYRWDSIASRYDELLHNVLDGRLTVQEVNDGAATLHNRRP